MIQRWFAQRLPDEGAFVTLEVAFDDGRSGFRGGGCRRRQSHRYPCSASIPLSFPKETFYGVGGPSLPSPHEGEGLERPQVTRCEPCDLQRKTHWSTLKVSSIEFLRSFSWNSCQLLIEIRTISEESTYYIWCCHGFLATSVQWPWWPLEAARPLSSLSPDVNRGPS